MALPNRVTPQMDTALHTFIQAQAEGHWDRVAELLGRYRRGRIGYMEYSPRHKECLIRAMQTAPMVAFDYHIQETPFSSEILTTAPNRKWWTLVGEGTFRGAAGVQKRGTYLTAYRNKDGWFFTPPPIDNALTSSRLSNEQLAADLKDRVEVRIPPGAPVEITELHVRIDPDNVASRKIEFKLHNKTPQKITAYSFVIGDRGEDGISVGTGAERDAILPESNSRLWTEDYLLYTYWCEGESQIKISVQDVTFSDGTTWVAPKSKDD